MHSSGYTVWRKKISIPRRVNTKFCKYLTISRRLAYANLVLQYLFLFYLHSNVPNLIIIIKQTKMYLVPRPLVR